MSKPIRLLNHCRMPIEGTACGSRSQELRGMTGARNPIPPMETFEVSAGAGPAADAGSAATASMNTVASIVRFKGILLLGGLAGSSDRTRPNLGAFSLRTNRTKRPRGLEAGSQGRAAGLRRRGDKYL